MSTNGAWVISMIYCRRHSCLPHALVHVLHAHRHFVNSVGENVLSHLKLASNVEGLVCLRDEECTQEARVLALWQTQDSNQMKWLVYSFTDHCCVIVGRRSTSGILCEFTVVEAHLVSGCTEKTQQHREVDSLHVRLEEESATAWPGSDTAESSAPSRCRLIDRRTFTYLPAPTTLYRDYTLTIDYVFASAPYL